MNNANAPPKWYSTIEIIDIETGEIITKQQARAESYYVTKKYKITEFNQEENYGTIKWCWECKKSTQTRLFE